jgi:heme/copper-type cytochrome/quinol oxidase subunit 3
MEASERPHLVPRRAGTIAMWLFLGSLGMLFAASMLGYVLIRVTTGNPTGNEIHLPSSLWVSTLMMLASSYTMHRALLAIRREKQALFRTYLTATIVFASIFVVIQTPAMVQLIHEHKAAQAQFEAQKLNAQPVTHDPSSNADEVMAGRRSFPFYGLIMVLILIHALHVVGGMISLGIVSYHGYQGRYDHEHHTGVSHCVLYWHFLDVVWIVMFTIISLFK